MELNTVAKADCIVHMKTLKSESVDLLYTDVPYNMGTKYIIDSEGHYVIKGKGSDFMNRWEIGDGRWWYEWFEEAYRIIKPGGYLITHNIDRQSDMWTYYGRRAGFYPTQKLYWLFIDNFPKGVDTGLIIDNYLGVEREVVGVKNGAQAVSTGKYGSWGKTSIMDNLRDSKMVGQNYLKGKMSAYEDTIATSDLAKKYDGYKHGIAPDKQVVEEILVLWKEPTDMNTVQCINRFEQDIETKGISNIHPPVRNIKETRLVNKDIKKPSRWTPQLAIDTRILKKIVEEYDHEDASNLTEPLQKIQYNEEEFVQYKYVKKATVQEKEFGLENFQTSSVEESERKNTHPTSKPIALGEWVLRQFAIPDVDKMVMLDPFAGSGSILISAQNLGMQYLGIELSEEYHPISIARLEAYKNKDRNLFGDLK